MTVTAHSKMSQVHTTVACRSIDKAVDSLVAQLGGIINRLDTPWMYEEPAIYDNWKFASSLVD